MFFALSKILLALTYPTTWIAIFVLGALLLRSSRLKRYCTKSFLVLFIVFTNPWISNKILRSWEVHPVPTSQLKEDNYVAIILSGVTNTGAKPTDRVHFTRGADRVLHTIQLFKQGKVDHIIISGGSGRLLGDKDCESAELKRVCILSGVPESAITTEETSRNTYENALNTSSIVNSRFSDRPLLLVTSAFHMKRSLSCFEKQGMQATPFSVDMSTQPPRYTPDLTIVPSAAALFQWQILNKEVVGYIMYSLKGYI